MRGRRGGLPATLGLRTYLGRAYQYQCEAGQGTLSPTAGSPPRSKRGGGPGARVTLTPNPDQCAILAPEFEGATDQRLGPDGRCRDGPSIKGGWLLDRKTAELQGVGDGPPPRGRTFADIGAGRHCLTGIVNPALPHGRCPVFAGLGEDVATRCSLHAAPGAQVRVGAWCGRGPPFRRWKLIHGRRHLRGGNVITTRPKVRRR